LLHPPLLLVQVKLMVKKEYPTLFYLLLKKGAAGGDAQPQVECEI
jgi:hypothetical protein